jgi:hypothetical protein
MSTVYFFSSLSAFSVFVMYYFFAECIFSDTAKTTFAEISEDMTLDKDQSTRQDE